MHHVAILFLPHPSLRLFQVKFCCYLIGFTRLVANRHRTSRSLSMPTIRSPTQHWDETLAPSDAACDVVVN